MQNSAQIVVKRLNKVEHMCLFRYREKRYGKLAFILFSVLLIALSVASVLGGVYAFKNLDNWARIALLVVGIIGGLAFGGFGLFLFLMSFSLINQSQSVRDGNKAKGIANTRLCDFCGRVITKNAEFCEHCGEKQKTGNGLKSCPSCKTKNSGAAEFCEHCGAKFE